MAVFWRSGTQIVSQIVAWGVTIFVMRMLDPRDYGLFTMTQVVTTVLNFLNGYGFANALIRTESFDTRRIRQTFGMLILLNGSLAVVQLLAAPLAAAYFHKSAIDQSTLTAMLRWQALIYLPVPFIAVPSAILARGLDFKKQAITNLLSALSGAVTAFVCVSLGYGVWTLVAAPIVTLSTRALGLTIAARLLVWPSFNLKGAGDIVRYGTAMLAAQFFWIIQSQADVTIGGRVLEPHALGLYGEALFITQIFTGKFLPPLNEVAFPSYAELAKTGASVGPAFITAAKLVMALTLPLYFGLSVTAGPLVATVLGHKWLEMIPLVSLLALAMPFWTLQLMFQPATNALGLPKIYVYSHAIGAAILVTCFLIGIHWGVSGLAIGWLVATPLLLIVTARMSLPAMRTSAGALVIALWPSLLAATAMAASVHYASKLMTGWADHNQLITLVALGATVYVGLLYVFARQALGELVMLVTKRRLPGGV